jgi:DNA invertase Pin-like site-specific DNA recombinase
VHFVSISERIDTNSAIGVAIFSILAAIAQLERDLIRKLLKSGLSFRQVSSIARCSHGSVNAEKQPMKREEEELRRKLAA